MHPVARLNLGKGRKETKIQIQIEGDDGNGDTLHFEPNPSYTFWNRASNVAEVDISYTTKIPLKVNFGLGASGENPRSITEFVIYAPGDPGVFDIGSTSTEIVWLSARPVPPAILRTRGLDSNYKSYNFEFIDQTLRYNDNYNRTVTIPVFYNSKSIIIELKLEVV